MSLDAYIASRFADRHVRFYHAENLRNFKTYCSAGAVLCRAELMKRDPVGYTRFSSDLGDRAKGALTRVFGNLYDFGAIFARGRGAVPNIYGPVTLVFLPRCFAKMSDVAITARSIATLDNSWRSQAIASRDAVDAVVQGGSFDSPIGDDWTYAELSCANTELSFENVERVVVEPISVGGTSLAELVRQAVDAKLKCPIEEREYSLPTNYSAIGELAKICDRFPMGLQDIPWPLPSAALPAAFADLPDHRKRRLCGWCRYFYFGTVQEVRREAELSEETDDRTICEICDPGDERPPALVNYSPWLAEDQERPRIDVGYCDWCNGLSIRCKKCGAVTAVPESSYEESLECEGGCGLRFVVSYDGNPAEGSAEIVEIVSDEQ